MKQKSPEDRRWAGSQRRICKNITLERVPLDLNRGILLAVWLNESIGIDSPVGATTMPKALSGDLRARVIEAVEAGASRREAAERFEISASSAVKWLQRWRDYGGVRRNRAAVAVLFWRTMASAPLPWLPSNRTERWTRLLQRCESDGFRATAARSGDSLIAMASVQKKPAGSRAAPSRRGASAAALASAAGLS